MVGKGRHPILGLMSPDPVLSLVGPVGLAASVGTALVIDLVADEPDPQRRTLRDIADDGPSLAELSPGRSGVAMIRAGGIDRSREIGVIQELAKRWPAVVIRVTAGDRAFPVVPAVPLFPGGLIPAPEAAHCVWQPVGAGSTPPGPGPVLPRLRPGALRRMLSGHLPRRSRWIDSWQPVWEMPWA